MYYIDDLHSKEDDEKRAVTLELKDKYKPTLMLFAPAEYERNFAMLQGFRKGIVLSKENKSREIVFDLKGIGAISELKCKMNHNEEERNVKATAKGRTVLVEFEIDRGLYEFELYWKEGKINKSRVFKLQVDRFPVQDFASRK